MASTVSPGRLEQSQHKVYANSRVIMTDHLLYPDLLGHLLHCRSAKTGRTVELDDWLGTNGAILLLLQGKVVG